MLGLFAAIDLSRPPESRTHLGRFADKLVSGDFSIVLQRKLESNISVLTSTIWTLVIPVALVFFAYLTWRPGGSCARSRTRTRPSGRSACPRSRWACWPGV